VAYPRAVHFQANSAWESTAGDGGCQTRTVSCDRWREHGGDGCGSCGGLMAPGKTHYGRATVSRESDTVASPAHAIPSARWRH
jgi:hypothetical protein